MADGMIMGKVTATGLYKFVRVPDNFEKGMDVVIISKQFMDKVYREGLILEKDAYEQMCAMFDRPKDVKPVKKDTK